jgi:hypothetical protein
MSFENQNAPNPENLSLDQLSPELMEKTSEALAYPVIALCPDGQQIGSGVLVEVDEWGVRHSANLLNRVAGTCGQKDTRDHHQRWKPHDEKSWRLS